MNMEISQGGYRSFNNSDISYCGKEILEVVAAILRGKLLLMVEARLFSKYSR